MIPWKSHENGPRVLNHSHGDVMNHSHIHIVQKPASTHPHIVACDRSLPIPYRPQEWEVTSWPPTSSHCQARASSFSMCAKRMTTKKWSSSWSPFSLPPSAAASPSSSSPSIITITTHHHHDYLGHCNRHVRSSSCTRQLPQCNPSWPCPGHLSHWTLPVDHEDPRPARSGHQIPEVSSYATLAVSTCAIRLVVSGGAVSLWVSKVKSANLGWLVVPPITGNRPIRPQLDRQDSTRIKIRLYELMANQFTNLFGQNGITNCMCVYTLVNASWWLKAILVIMPTNINGSLHHANIWKPNSGTQRRFFMPATVGRANDIWWAGM